MNEDRQYLIEMIDNKMLLTAQVISRNIPASTPADRKTRRALVKAMGARQFKKQYRKAQV